MQVETIYGAYIAVLVFGTLAYGDAVIDRVADLREGASDINLDPPE